MILAVAFCVIAVVVIAFWAILVGPWIRQKRWGRLERSLGLKASPPTGGGWVIIPFEGPFPSQPLHGIRGNLSVTVGTRWEWVYTGRTNARSKRYFTYVTARLPENLGLDLQLQREGLIGRLFDRMAGMQDLQIGDAAVDRMLRVQSTDPEAALRLLRLPYVLQGLAWAADDGWTLSVTDATVTYQKRRIQYSPSTIGRRLDKAVELARRLAAGRSETRVDGIEMARLERWRHVAQELGFEASAQGIAGRRHGMYVEVGCEKHGEDWWTSFTVRYDRSLGLSLQLTRQAGFSLQQLMGAQDIVVGDPGFDERFVIKGAPTARVREILTPEVRAALATLQDQATQLVIEDDHLAAWVGWRVLDPEHLKWGIDTVARTGAALAGVAPVQVGPFRGAPGSLGAGTGMGTGS